MLFGNFISESLCFIKRFYILFFHYRYLIFPRVNPPLHECGFAQIIRLQKVQHRQIIKIQINAKLERKNTQDDQAGTPIDQKRVKKCKKSNYKKNAKKYKL